jgi:DNA-damage-inducible protein D
MKDTSLTVFEGKQIRRYYDENTETWYFSVVDIIQVLKEVSRLQNVTD